MMDFIPEAHTLLMVVAGVPRVKPGDTMRDVVTFAMINKRMKIESHLNNYILCLCVCVSDWHRTDAYLNI